MRVKKILKKLILKEKASSEEYISFLRNKGMKIGDNCTIYWPQTTRIDYQNPYMVTIGNNVKITEGVRILTHDYSMSVMSSVNGDIVGSVKGVVIGNNVFIGIGATILAGTQIEDNVIIGAGSIVSGTCKENSVYAGVPAKRICSLEELYIKRKKQERESAKEVALQYYERTHKKPNEKVLREYLMLFNRRDNIPLELEKLMRDSGNYELCRRYFYGEQPQFNGLDDFLKWCGIIDR